MLIAFSVVSKNAKQKQKLIVERVTAKYEIRLYTNGDEEYTRSRLQCLLIRLRRNHVQFHLRDDDLYI